MHGFCLEVFGLLLSCIELLLIPVSYPPPDINLERATDNSNQCMTSFIYGLLRPVFTVLLVVFLPKLVCLSSSSLDSCDLFTAEKEVYSGFIRIFLLL